MSYRCAVICIFELIGVIFFCVGSYIGAFSIQGCGCDVYPSWLRLSGVSVEQAFKDNAELGVNRYCGCTNNPGCGTYSMGCVTKYSFPGDNICDVTSCIWNCNNTICADRDSEGLGLYLFDSSQVFDYYYGWFIAGALILLSMFFCFCPYAVQHFNQTKSPQPPQNYQLNTLQTNSLPPHTSPYDNQNTPTSFNSNRDYESPRHDTFHESPRHEPFSQRSQSQRTNINRSPKQTHTLKIHQSHQQQSHRPYNTLPSSMRSPSPKTIHQNQTVAIHHDMDDINLQVLPEASVELDLASTLLQMKDDDGMNSPEGQYYEDYEDKYSYFDSH